MNYLAHSFLSFNDQQVVGNLIGDFIKNRDRQHLPEKVQQGIVLHRAIDAFTDVHPEVSEAKKVFQPLVRLYAGAFVDVVFDYFLANDRSILSEEDWLKYTAHVYTVLNDHEPILPEKFRSVLPKMQKDNWLFNYRYDWGIEYSIRNVLHKAQFLDVTLPVYEVFLDNKELLQQCYDRFFPDLRQFCFKMNETF